ncbi:folliculin-interacting protein 1 isoform X2 [Leptopilina boulardi]|uniref:folliculin-interacting protein 1 isoform X2 n=1 Tax=Leptopilina boulardi TaxID=63433 RepID=UPI0021F5416E|nr:folliculin-interacting protein 1 isoform X2 [Leptopilina boulardi]
MSFITKLFLSKNDFTKQNAIESDTPLNIENQTNERKSLNFGTDQVRILLFRECEWRGRKLLFDSVTVEKSQPKNSSFCSLFKSEKEKKCKPSGETVNGIVEQQKLANEDVNLLSEMVFGTVAMTYRGPSFKIHTINSPPCIMCTKVFPASEHSTCRKSEKQSDERIVHNPESNSSSGSVRTQDSRPSSGNLSANSLSPNIRKSSTCSSTGSGWDIDICLPHGSHSLESNFSGKGNSLNSLRRRWIRSISTSLSPTESDYLFTHYNENSNEQEKNVRRHKTRLGLALLIRLTRGHEQEMESKLLEHAAFLEGMLNRLRLSCAGSNKGQNKDKGNELITRLQKASSCCTIWLLRFLMNSTDSTTPLLWHDTMLNTTLPKEERFNIIHNGLKEMCRLLDNFDTKSTKFFLSTLVTAVLTHHLGWVHTVSSGFNRETVEKLRKQFPCNPLWAQLGDLYGALGNPVKVVHTVIAGDSDKVDTINSILIFLTYFIRSGIVKKEYERRCKSQQDVQEAIILLEQLKKRNRPSLSKPSIIPNNSRVRKTSKRRVELKKSDLDEGKIYESNQRKISEAVTPKLKRSSTLLKNLDTLNGLHPKFEFDSHWIEESEMKTNTAASKVKIIVSETSPCEIRKDQSMYRENALQELEKKFNDEVDDAFMETKLDTLTRDRLSEIRKLNSDDLGIDSYSLPSNIEFSNQRQETQVFFTLGDEEKPLKSRLLPRCNCQCAFTFTKVPSTSADLPEGVLRKIIQRNFPESSKNMQVSPEAASNDSLSCLKCRRRNKASKENYENDKLHLETPTNATDVLRSCVNSCSNDGMFTLPDLNSFEALMEANNVIELPMPRSNQIPIRKKIPENVGFTNSLISRKIVLNEKKKSLPEICDSEYTWGLVMQGMIKRKKSRRKYKDEKDESEDQVKNWWQPMREEIEINARFPSVDQPVAESLCILADLDTWQVGLLSNNSPVHNPPLPIGMSRLVANMLEGFSYIWKKYHSTEDCIQLLESRLREMWLRSETLAEMLMTVDPYDINVNNLTNSLDMDAADLPLLLAVATTHSPQITQKFGLTLA